MDKIAINLWYVDIWINELHYVVLLSSGLSLSINIFSAIKVSDSDRNLAIISKLLGENR